MDTSLANLTFEIYSWVKGTRNEVFFFEEDLKILRWHFFVKLGFKKNQNEWAPLFRNEYADSHSHQDKLLDGYRRKHSNYVNLVAKLNRSIKAARAIIWTDTKLTRTGSNLFIECGRSRYRAENLAWHRSMEENMLARPKGRQLTPLLTSTTSSIFKA